MQLENQRITITKRCQKCGSSYTPRNSSQKYCNPCRSKKSVNAPYCGFCGRHLSGGFSKLEVNGKRICGFCKNKRSLKYDKRSKLSLTICPDCNKPLVKYNNSTKLFCVNQSCSIIRIDRDGIHRSSLTKECS